MSIIPKLVFLIPYRNRLNEKTHFNVYIKYLLEDYEETDYEIYYIHQNDKRPFNRGGIKNVGFLVLKEKYANDYKNITFVFNDIDTLPYKKNLLNYETNKGIIKHYYGFRFALGGIFSIKGEDFERCNGFPNNWGWGFEDNKLNDKVIQNKLIIDRSNFYEVNSSEFMQINNENNKTINIKETENHRRKFYQDDLTKINNIEYTISNENMNSNNCKYNNVFIIDTTNFNTLMNPDYKYFKNHDIKKNGNRIKTNEYSTLISRNRWSLQNLKK